MSGIRPFEGSGELLLTTVNTSSTTVTEFHHNDSATKTSTSTTIDLVDFKTTSVQVQSNSTPYPLLLPFWGWAAVLVGGCVLVSVTFICVFLLVGWRKDRRRRNYQVNRRSQTSRRCNSSLWIDLEQVDSTEEATCTNGGATLERREGSHTGKSTCDSTHSSDTSRQSGRKVKVKQSGVKNSLFLRQIYVIS